MTIKIILGLCYFVFVPTQLFSTTIFNKSNPAFIDSVQINSDYIKASTKVLNPKLICRLSSVFKKEDTPIGSGYDVYAIASSVLLLLAFILFLAFIASLAFEALIILGLLAIVLALLSLAAAIVSIFRFKKNSKLMGRGFMYATLGAWGLYLLAILISLFSL
jgi:hypothetical protein